MESGTIWKRKNFNMGSIKKGILLLAIGHDNYFKMAVNLAASIKHNSPDVSITLISDGTRMLDSALFDDNIIIDPQGPLHAYKTKLYELTPYDKTLYLDVDMIAVLGTNFGAFIDSLEGVPFTIMNVKKEQCIWADPLEVRKASGNEEDPMYIVYSELIYFEKSKEAKAVFSEAKKQANSKISTRPFAGAVADELAFIIAMMKLKIQPHKANWLPVFWYYRSRKDQTMQPYKMKDNYIAYSIGGNVTPSYVKANYNNLAIFYGQKMGIARPYKVLDKRTFLPGRAKI